MDIKTVRVTGKGQISLPVRIRESLKILEGDELLIMKEADSIVIKKIRESDFKDLLKHSEKVASKLWSNKEDEVWDNV